MKGVWVLDGADKIWFGILSVVGIVFLVVGYALWSPLLIVGRPWFFTIESQRFFSLPLFAAGFFFLVLSWFVASGESGRVLRVSFVLGLVLGGVSIVVSTFLPINVLFDLTQVIQMVASGLVFGSIFALFYKVTRVDRNPASASRR
jgi:hypothetical protein